MHPAFWGEFAGTAVLILLGNGVVACVVLKKSYGHGSGWMVITAGWCFAVLAGVITALAVGSHAHQIGGVAHEGSFPGADVGLLARRPVVLSDRGPCLRTVPGAVVPPGYGGETCRRAMGPARDPPLGPLRG